MTRHQAEYTNEFEAEMRLLGALRNFTEQPLVELRTRHGYVEARLAFTDTWKTTNDLLKQTRHPRVDTAAAGCRP